MSEQFADFENLIRKALAPVEPPAELEAQVAAFTAAMADPAFYAREGAAITAHTTELARVQADLDAAYARWEALESLSHG